MSGKFWTGAAVLAALLTATGAGAAPIDEVRGGVLVQGLGPLASDKEDGVSLNGEFLFSPLRSLSFIGAPRPHLGLSVATGEYATSQIYAGLTWELNVTPVFFLNAGVGVAVHDGETDFNPPDPLVGERNYLGCRALARLSGGVGYRLTPNLNAALHLDHISNAGLCSENEGLDNMGLRLGYSF